MLPSLGGKVCPGVLPLTQPMCRRSNLPAAVRVMRALSAGSPLRAGPSWTVGAARRRFLLDAAGAAPRSRPSAELRFRVGVPCSRCARFRRVGPGCSSSSGSRPPRRRFDFVARCGAMRGRRSPLRSARCAHGALVAACACAGRALSSGPRRSRAYCAVRCFLFRAHAGAALRAAAYCAARGVTRARLEACRTRVC